MKLFTAAKIAITPLLLIVALRNVSAQVADPANVYTRNTTVQAYVESDMDSDGMLNWWEVFYGLDPTNPADAALDADNDGLTNLEEFNYSTNPNSQDTDSGGVSDYQEILVNKDPLDGTDDLDPIGYRAKPEPPEDKRGDSDGDGLSNEMETLLGTNKHSIDTDDDGLNDNEELFKYRTNPKEKDTDLDGINDFDEINKFFTNPNAKDSDFDGLSDYEEIFTYRTNPTIWDTDTGGMSDFDEIKNELNPLLKDDDYKYTWNIYYCDKPNELFTSLNKNKIDIFTGMNLTLEALKPEEAEQITLNFNKKSFTTEKDVFKVKIIAPSNPGLYVLEVIVELKNGRNIKMTKYIELKKMGEIIQKADGQFNNLYSKFSIFDRKRIENARIETYIFSDVTNKLELFHSDIFPEENPLLVGSTGVYAITLHPGNYLIKVTVPNVGQKEILFSTERYTIFSENVFITYNYDKYIWGAIFISIFVLVWNLIITIEFITSTIRHVSKENLKRARHI